MKNTLLHPWIEKYKNLIQDKLPELNYSEVYKWETIQHFQDNWTDSHNENTIQDLIVASFNNESNNLWAGNHFFPFAMIKEFAQSKPAKVHSSIFSLEISQNAIP